MAETYTDEQYKADCAAIDKVVQEEYRWWLNEAGRLELEYDPRSDDYSVAEVVYENRDKPLDEFRVAVEDKVYADWSRQVEDFMWDIIDQAGIGHSDFEREDAARQYIFDTYDPAPPFDELLDERLKVNILLATETEQDLDFASIQDMSENLREGYEVSYDLMDNALVQLAESQGYLFDDVAAAYKCALEEGYEGCLAKHGMFLATVADEMQNFVNVMGTLTVLAEVPARDLPLLTKPGYEFKVDGSTVIGIYAPWVGGGSELNIDLEKPVTLSSDLVFDVQVEGVECEYGYTVNETYGLVPDAWDYQIKVEAARDEEPPVKEGAAEGRKPGELKQAVGKPAPAVTQAATPGEDGRACSASAAARGVEAVSHEVKRQK